MKLAILFLILIPSAAQAGLFKIVNRNYGSAGAYQADLDVIFNTLENQVNALLPASDNASFMTSMANNAVLSGAGNSAYYGSPFQIFEASVQAGISVESERAPSESITLNRVGGVGAQAQVRLGSHLNIYGDKWWIFDLERAWMYVGLLTYDYSKDVTNFRFGAASVYFQYRLTESSSALWNSLKWNGLFVGTGLRYISLKVNMEQPVTETVSQVVDTMPGTPTVTANYNGRMAAGAEVQALSVPIELSISARILYAFTFFFGVGADISLGKAKSIANLTGPVTITESSASYGSFSGDALLDIGDEGSPRTIGARSFSGIAFEIGAASIHVITTRSIPERDTAVNAGLRLYW
ncbi:MAG: hypothetical protein ABL958_01265 [Bdellovibrionia bacterium]